MKRKPKKAAADHLADVWVSLILAVIAEAPGFARVLHRGLQAAEAADEASQRAAGDEGAAWLRRHGVPESVRYLLARSLAEESG
jgi:hypothetical protein